MIFCRKCRLHCVLRKLLFDFFFFNFYNNDEKTSEKRKYLLNNNFYYFRLSLYVVIPLKISIENLFSLDTKVYYYFLYVVNLSKYGILRDIIKYFIF